MGKCLGWRLGKCWGLRSETWEGEVLRNEEVAETEEGEVLGNVKVSKI